MRLVPLAAATWLLAAAPVIVADAPHLDAAHAAGAWFRTQLNSDGTFIDASNADYGNTAMITWLAPGVTALGGDLHDWRAGPDGTDPVTWWRAHADASVRATPNSCTDLSRVVFGLAALQEDPRTFAGRDWVAELRECHEGTGIWDDAETPADDGYLNNEAYGILALRAAGAAVDDPDVAPTVNVLLAAQYPDGGWSFAPVRVPGSQVDDTAQILLCLLTVLPPDHLSIERGLSWLSREQEPDGSFVYLGGPQPWSTAAVVETIVAAGEDPDSGRWKKDRSALSHLLSYRDPGSGAFLDPGGEADAKATYDALRGLSGGVLPVTHPTLRIRASSAVAESPTTFEADGSVPVGRIVEWQWDLGDGERASGPRVAHAFASAGSHVVRLTATTDRNVRAAVEATIEVAPAPTFSLEAPERALRDAEVTATVVATGATQYRFDWGDGTSTSWGPASTASHAYAALGEFVLRVASDGSEGLQEATTPIRIVNAPPALAAPAAVAADRVGPVRFAAEATDADGPAPAVRWRFDDGVLLEGAVATRSFAALGEVRAVVEAVDADGAVARQEFVVDVANLPPTLALVAPRDAVVGEPAVVRAVAADTDGPAPRVAWGDGASGGESAVDTSAPGERVVRAVATDADGAAVEASAVFRVRAADAPPPTGIPLALSARPEPQAPRRGDPAALALAPSGGTPPYALRVQVAGADVPVDDGRADLGLLEAPVAWTAWVRDADGDVVSLSGLARPAPDAPPVARVVIASDASRATVDASGSRDPEGRTLLYRVRWGDGEVDTWTRDAVATHEYASPGVYTVTVEVRDAADALARASATVLATAPPREERLTAAATRPVEPEPLRLAAVEEGEARPAAAWGSAALVALALAAALPRRGRRASDPSPRRRARR